MEDSTPSVPQPKPQAPSAARHTTVVLTTSDHREVELSEEEARAFYSQLRKWYGRGKA